MLTSMANCHDDDHGLHRCTLIIVWYCWSLLWFLCLDIVKMLFLQDSMCKEVGSVLGNPTTMCGVNSYSDAALIRTQYTVLQCCSSWNPADWLFHSVSLKWLRNCVLCFCCQILLSLSLFLIIFCHRPHHSHYWEIFLLYIAMSRIFFFQMKI